MTLVLHTKLAPPEKIDVLMKTQKHSILISKAIHSYAKISHAGYTHFKMERGVN